MTGASTPPPRAPVRSSRRARVGLPVALGAMAVLVALVAWHLQRQRGGGAAATPERPAAPLLEPPGIGALLDGRPRPCPCPRFGAPVTVGRVESGALDETSGIAFLPTAPAVLVALNDSGAPADLHLLSAQGAALGVVRLPVTAPVDWEDVGRGPCASGTCLFVADVGDNDAARASVQLHVIPTAALRPGPVTTGLATYELRYEDGARDTEAVVVHPRTGSVLLVSKGREGRSHVYELAPGTAPGEVITVRRVSVVQRPPRGHPQITAADVDACGRTVVVRTYTDLWAYPVGEPWQRGLEGVPAQLPSAREPQGEAVAFTPEGHLVTVSEGRAPWIYLVPCEG